MLQSANFDLKNLITECIFFVNSVKQIFCKILIFSNLYSVSIILTISLYWLSIANNKILKITYSQKKSKNETTFAKIISQSML